MKKIIIIIVVILVAIVITAFLNKKQQSTFVEIGKAEKRVIVKTVSATGIIEAGKEVKISSNISATIKKLFVKDGNYVKKGDLLLVLDRDNIESKVLRQRALLAQQKFNSKTIFARLKQSKLDYKKNKQLADKKLISETDFERIEINLDIANTNYKASLQSIKSSEADLDQSLDDLNKTEIYAPISGTITSLNKEIGETVLGSMVSSDIILKIADLTKLQAKATVDENDISQITLNDSVVIHIDAFEDVIFKGVLTEIGNTAIRSGSSQDQSVSYSVTIEMIDKNINIKPGMTSNVDIVVEVTKPVLTIPIQALTRRKSSELKKDKKEKPKQKAQIWNNEKEYVDVIFKVIDSDDSKKVKISQVKTGISNNRFIEIKSGLDEGEKLVVGNYKTLSKTLKDDLEITYSDNKDSE